MGKFCNVFLEKKSSEDRPWKSLTFSFFCFFLSQSYHFGGTDKMILNACLEYFLYLGLTKISQVLNFSEVLW